MEGIRRYNSAVILLSILIVAAVAVFIVGKDGAEEKLTPRQERFLPRDTLLLQGVTKTSVAEGDIEIIAEDLSVPWEIVFLPSGDLLVTERAGTIKRIGSNKETLVVEGVSHIGEGGLLGMALHPDFERTRWLYLYLTTNKEGKFLNRVVRYRFTGQNLSDEVIIVDDIPSVGGHSGGRITFGPDGYLYISAGDAQEPQLAQDTRSLAGKILRVKEDGGIPSDNPFGNAVYSYGHRNPQGLAWDSKGGLWATEHGPSGAQSGFDELNLIEKGANYGWPSIKGDEEKNGMRTPIVHSGPDDTWAPAGAVYMGTSVFFTGLRGQSLYEVMINGDGSAVRMTAHFRKDFGRLRALVEGPDGYLYVTTSNTDGRGVPQEGDDKIIRINPEVFGL